MATVWAVGCQLGELHFIAHCDRYYSYGLKNFYRKSVSELHG